MDGKLEGNSEGGVGMGDRGREKGPEVYNPAMQFLGMTKMPLLPIRKLTEVSSIGQVS